MSNFDGNNPSYLHESSSNSRETDNYSSNLQATAAEYYPPNRNQGAVKKKFNRQNYDNSKSYNHKEERQISQSNLQADAQEFYPSTSAGGTRKKYQEKTHKNNSNWRYPSIGYDVPYYNDSNNFRNSKHYNGKKHTSTTNNYDYNSVYNDTVETNVETSQNSKKYSYGRQKEHINNYYGHYNEPNPLEYETDFQNSKYSYNSKSANSNYNHYNNEPQDFSAVEKLKKYSSTREHNTRRQPHNTNNYENYHYNNYNQEPSENGSNNKRYNEKYRAKSYKDSRQNWSNTNRNNQNDSESKQFNIEKSKNKFTLNKKNKILATASQRECLTEMIDGNLLECMVCCEKIKRTDKVWSCSQCYHIIHLNCIAAWANSSKVEQHWRCPACQNIYAEIPNYYSCYCGQVTDPKLNPNIIAHGCDNMCLKKGKQCDHKCNLLCHPGPCPECNVMVSKPCGCGSTQQVVKCCSDIKIVCQAICNKTLNCELHKCTKICHADSCLECIEQIIQECYCQKTGRKVPCNKENIGKTSFICENTCDKLLPCGIHKCDKQCHPGPCNPCASDITLIKNCHCTKTPLESPRKSCLDPIPTCNKICAKTLICGPPSKPHLCKEKCHEGKCPPCPLTTVIKCRCGHMDKEIACQKLTTKADDARCEKKCTKKRLCGKHTCKQKCCIEIEHVCPLPCNKLLSCGLHKCELTCHSGRCPSCIETSFEELFCACGASVLYPPIPCGTKLPVCDKPCSKPRPCGHPPNHECHPGNCPACFVLTKQWCFGKHEQRAAIPCQQKSFSCGLACGKPMPCGRHKCNKPCHEGDCPVPCSQPCSVLRELCGHPCNKPCHDMACPDSNCKQMVPVTCLCGLQKSSKICMDLTDEFKNLEMSQLKDQISNFNNETVDITNMTMKKPSVLKILECNDECKILERNRRLAIGLQIQNPDLSQKLTPRYSDFLKQWAKKDPKFCQRVHDKLTELVQLAKQSKQKSRSYSFESMNRDKRHFIHEYCEYFGMESAAYDAEPNRNVVATAIKDKSWLPGMSLLEVLQRENGQRKVPGPVLGYSSSNENETVSLKLLTSANKNLGRIF